MARDRVNGQAQARAQLVQAPGDAPASGRGLVKASADGAVFLNVHVTPRANRPGVAGIREGALHVRVHAAPSDGAANAELAMVLGAVFAVPKSAVSIVTGEYARLKRIRVAAIDIAQAELRLAAFMPAAG